MANLTTTADIKAAILQHSGELSTGTYNSLIDTYINRVYHEIVGGGSTFIPELGEPWEWAKAQNPGVLILKVPYETGTVSLTNGSVSGTFNTAPSVGLGSLAGRLLKVTDRPEFFRIATHTAGAGAFTIDAAYTDETGAALGFSAHKLDYDLTSGIARLIEPMRTYRAQQNGDDDGKINGCSSDALSTHFPLHRLTRGAPDTFAMLREVNGLITVRFNRSPAEETRVEYEYIPTPSDLTSSPDTTPLIPRDDRVVLAYGGTYFLMIDKEDTRADTFFRLCQSKLQAMILERRKRFSYTNHNYAKLLPRQEQLSDNVIRGASGIRYV
jgi:hypothetical protein